jgi:hypothetical protein
MFIQALEAGDLARVRHLAAEIGHVSLGDAARILALICVREPGSFERAAVRWMARYATERAHTVGDLASAVNALEDMREDPRADAALASLVR